MSRIHMKVWFENNSRLRRNGNPGGSELPTVSLIRCSIERRKLRPTQTTRDQPFISCNNMLRFRGAGEIFSCPGERFRHVLIVAIKILRGGCRDNDREIDIVAEYTKTGLPECLFFF
jgi:hypothetical protein